MPETPLDVLADELAGIANDVERAVTDRVNALVADAQRKLSEIETRFMERRFALVEFEREVMERVEARLASVRDGKDGEQGPPGVDGRDGEPGTPGRDGIDGRDGEAGSPGRDGIDGRDGEPGRDGIDGKDGEQGEQGPPGRDGIDGKDGEQGAPGRDGVDGKDGRDGKDAYPGEARGLYDPEASYRSLDVVSFNGSEWRAKKDDPGPLPGDGWMLSASKGKRGERGEKGDRGDKGERGAPGLPLVAAHVDPENPANVILTNGDGSVVTLDLYPSLLVLKGKR